MSDAGEREPVLALRCGRPTGGGRQCRTICGRVYRVDDHVTTAVVATASGTAEITEMPRYVAVVERADRLVHETAVADPDDPKVPFAWESAVTPEGSTSPYCKSHSLHPVDNGAILQAIRLGERFLSVS